MPSDRGAAGAEQEPVLKGEEEPAIEEGAFGRGSRGAQERYDFQLSKGVSTAIKSFYESLVNSCKNLKEFYKQFSLSSGFFHCHSSRHFCHLKSTIYIYISKFLP